MEAIDRRNRATIRKPYTPRPPASDARGQTGANAERQMAHCLHRAFAKDPDVHVLHDLWLRNPEQPEHTSTPGTCRIDHLLIHRWGMFIVESKSVTSEVRVRPDNTDGDEWTRVWNGAEKGIPSPIHQAKRQAQFLRTYLQHHKLELLGRQPVGMRTIAKLAKGTDQRGFRNVRARRPTACTRARAAWRRRWRRVNDVPSPHLHPCAGSFAEAPNRAPGRGRRAGALRPDGRPILRPAQSVVPPGPAGSRTCRPARRRGAT